MRGAMQTCRGSSLLLRLLHHLFGLFAVWKRSTVRSVVETRWMISPLGHIYYPNLSTVCARLCGLHSPQIARPIDRPTDQPTDRPPPFFFACRSSDRVQSDSVSPRNHTAAVSSFSSLFRFARRTRYRDRDRGWRSNNNNDDSNARGGA